jgi:hypothetical protein
VQELLLAEDDHGLVLDAAGEVVAPVRRLALLDEPVEEARAPREQAAAHRGERGERERAREDVYA